jgi:hypothetical protein
MIPVVPYPCSFASSVDPDPGSGSGSGSADSVTTGRAVVAGYKRDSERTTSHGQPEPAVAAAAAADVVAASSSAGNPPDQGTGPAWEVLAVSSVTAHSRTETVCSVRSRVS